MYTTFFSYENEISRKNILFVLEEHIFLRIIMIHYVINTILRLSCITIFFIWIVTYLTRIFTTVNLLFSSQSHEKRIIRSKKYVCIPRIA